MSVVLPQVWDEWLRVTRFLKSGKIAFEREENLWASLQMNAKSSTFLVEANAGGNYTLSVSDHQAAVGNKEMLFAAALVQSCAIVEAVVPLVLNGTKATGGVEAWGAACLESNGADWQAVLGGKKLIVTAYVTRNTWAHGSRELDSAAVTRLRAVGDQVVKVGDSINLSYGAVSSYRDGLRSLLRLSGVRAR